MTYLFEAYGLCIVLNINLLFQAKLLTLLIILRLRQPKKRSLCQTMFHENPFSHFLFLCVCLALGWKPGVLLAQPFSWKYRPSKAPQRNAHTWSHTISCTHSHTNAAACMHVPNHACAKSTQSHTSNHMCICTQYRPNHTLARNCRPANL